MITLDSTGFIKTSLSAPLNKKKQQQKFHLTRHKQKPVKGNIICTSMVQVSSPQYCTKFSKFIFYTNRLR